MADVSKRNVRSAIYTRKSTEEGLDQEFNSLDAQRDACEAYVRSQRHEGWTLLPDGYDDGGFSGGNMQRPALQRLLSDVSAGRVDVIVVYKIDRLTRSLSDFAKIVDVLDGSKASFVSVTQAFNTTTSMGRLTLNVLLSFAQFEREVTGERIRDKIAASKRKGLWMGGPVPLGYRVQDRKLLVVEEEAASVRHIFREYLRVGGVPELIQELHRQGIRTKSGVPFQRGGLYHLLRNTIYRGEISHKGASYPGEHERIVDDELWLAVQRHLDRRVERLMQRPRVTRPSLLTGLIFDGAGRSMSPTHARRGSRRYRYYISHGISASDAVKPTRLSAHLLERAVIERVAKFLKDRRAIFDALPHLEAAELEGVIGRAAQMSIEVRADPDRALRQLLHRVDLNEEAARVSVRLAALGAASDSIECLSADLPAKQARDVKVVIGAIAAPDGMANVVNSKLTELMREAMEARDLLLAGGKSVVEIAQALGRCRKRMTHLTRLSFFAPDIVEAIVKGRHPAHITKDMLLKLKDVPLDWSEQRRVLGFG